jgi:hypothetical protein
MSSVLLFGLFLPRLAIILLNIFTDWFNGVFGAWYWILIGFVFMPFTALWYSAVINWFDGEWNIWQTLIFAVAIITDISVLARSRQKKRRY